MPERGALLSLGGALADDRRSDVLKVRHVLSTQLHVERATHDVLCELPRCVPGRPVPAVAYETIGDRLAFTTLVPE